MSKTFTDAFNDCMKENPGLITEICEPRYQLHLEAIDRAIAQVDGLERDGYRTPKQAEALREAVRCVAENQPQFDKGLDIDYFTPTIYPPTSAVPVESDLSKKCNLQR